MARETFESWVPEEYGGPAITKAAAVSAVEGLARPEPMATDTKYVPRDGGMSFDGGIGKGLPYPETAATNDSVLLSAIKFGKILRVAEEDLRDTPNVVNIIATKRTAWARTWAIGFDNGALGTTAAANGTTVPFTSLYKALRTTNAATSYTADANRVAVATATAITYTNLSALFALVEGGAFWSDDEAVVIAHPYFKSTFRGILDSQNRPVFQEYQSAGSPAVQTLFGVPIRWSLGAKATATATDAPGAATNPLLFVGNRNMLIKGDRSGMEYVLAGADSGPAFTTDEALLKVRIRRGFAVANENAWAVLDKTL